jgi:hypothetical protein
MSNLLISLTQAGDPGAARHRDHVRAVRDAEAVASTAPIAVRLLGEADRPALARLAGRDSAEMPVGDVLGAHLGASLVAALSLADGRAVADPFRPSRPALELLQLRARQLGAPRRGLRRLRRRPRARGSLAGSPPGAGGRLLQL